MTSVPTAMFEGGSRRATPIRDLGLTIAGTALEPILEAFEREIVAAGITKIRPRFYLSTEWGVPYESIAIAIPSVETALPPNARLVARLIASATLPASTTSTEVSAATAVLRYVDFNTATLTAVVPISIPIQVGMLFRALVLVYSICQ